MKKSISSLIRAMVLVATMLTGIIGHALPGQTTNFTGPDGRISSGLIARAIKGTGQVVPDGYSTGYSTIKPTTGHAQQGGFNRSTDTLWTNHFGGDLKDECYSVAQTSDGGYIMIGRSNSFGAGDFDAWMIKTDQKGDAEWMQTYGDTYIDEAYDVKQTADGGYIIAGMSTAFGYAGEGWLIKTDAEGTITWSNGYHPKTGSAQSAWDYLYQVTETSDGDFVAFGHAFLEEGMLQAWILKVDADGDFLWEKLYGDEYWERLFSVDNAGDGGFIAVGDKHYTYNDSIYRHDGWLVRFDENGDTLWTNHFGADQHDLFRSVRETSDGGFIVSGERQLDEINGYYGWVVKTDAEGNEMWNLTTTEEGALMGIREMADGNFLASGTILMYETLYDGWLVNLNPAGEIISQNVISGSELDDMFLSMNATEDGGYIMAGKYLSQEIGDYWLVKISTDMIAPLTYFFENFDGVVPPDLPENWSSELDVMLSNTFAEVKTTVHGGAPTLPNSTFIMNGLNGSNGQLDSSAFVALITPFVTVGGNGSKITFQGNGGNAIQVGTMSDPEDASTFMLIEEVPLTYEFAEYTVTFTNPGNTYIALKHANASTTTPLFLDNLLYEQIGTVGVPEEKAGFARIYPNPASRLVNIESTQEISKIELYNYFGACVYKEHSFSVKSLSMNCSNISEGNYILRIVNVDGSYASQKLQIIH